MPAIDKTRHDGSQDLEVLITGFGPFATFKENPSWLSVKNLHDTHLSLNHPSEPSKEVKDGPSIHIQVIQSSVAYNHVLSLVPLIHGINPSAPEAKIYLDPNGPQPDTETKIGPQGNGSPFPEGYPISLPAKGKFDLVLHIGVGSRGNIEIEKLAHKRGYQIPDVVGQKAPIATNQSATTSRTSEKSESQKREEARSLSKKEEQSSSASEEAVRGFGKGYEAYQEEEVNSNNVTGLVEWLQQECQIKNVKQSHDAGRYLCDFIYYCSLCESKRRGAGTKVQFVHVPPTGEPQSTEECQATIQKVIWWLLCRG